MIEILDLGINNLSSISRAFISESGEEKVRVLDSPESESKPALIVLPGLGSFSSGMAALRERRLDEYLINKVNSGSYLVGICLGMQLLGDASMESPGVKGLAFISGDSIQLKGSEREKVPHIGWNRVCPAKGVLTMGQLLDNKDFYFVHSYHFNPKNHEDILTTTPFGPYEFASSVLRDRVLGFQFHPEKSGTCGRNLIRQVIRWAHCEK
jgi:glutamine amidotransferase